MFLNFNICIPITLCINVNKLKYPSHLKKVFCTADESRRYLGNFKFQANVSGVIWLNEGTIA